MKKIAALFIFITAFSYAQETTIHIDYTVDYAVPSKRKKTVDTISIGFNKEGKYLWTNYNELAVGLAQSLFKDRSKDFSSAKSNIIYNTETGSLILLFELDDNDIYFNLKIDNFLPGIGNNDESLTLITEEVGETIEVLGKDVEVYNMFPSNDPEDVITIATDKDYEVSNNQIFKKLFEIAFQSDDINTELTPDVPDGLILKIIEKDKTMIEAIRVNDKKKTIKINYSFKITE
jgi:hypothetical protein